jgi:hypothetical protein
MGAAPSLDKNAKRRRQKRVTNRMIYFSEKIKMASLCQWRKS